jgi:expansin (peptidoglycan-binding protein)
MAASVIANGGYGYSYNDGHGSTVCIDSTAMCGTGTTAVADAAGTIWGAGIGANLNQAQGTAASPNPSVNNYAATGTGIAYSLSNLPAQGMRIVIDNGGTDYCVPIAAASGTVGWASFNTKCWDNSGTFLSGAPATATHILFQVTADAASTPFNFCVTHVAFATTTPPPPDAGSGGGNGTGGCAWTGGPSTPSAGNGELTCYYFGQGTSQGGGCPTYKTFCGYCGTETGSNSGGTCTTGVTDTVSNISTGYFAAFPIGSFGQGKYCGMCVNVSYAGKTITATIVDECATCTNSGGHIDLNLSAAAALGVGQGGATGDPTNGVTWDAVACPVSGNIVAVFNNGSSGQIYFQNVAFPVASATAGGATGSQQSGFWNFGGLVAGKSVTLTDTLGHTVTGTIPTSSGGSIGAQFPAKCN